jgi:hypothetical protein
MKKSRLLIALLVMLVAASGYAQDSYREAVKQYLLYLGPDNQMKTALCEMKDAFFVPSGNVDLDLLTERYIKEVMIDQMTDMTETMMKERNVTEVDLRTVNAMVSPPEFQTFLSHLNEWDEKITRISDESISLLKDGGEPENVQVNPDIDPDYAAKFQKMWKESGILEKSLGLYDRISLGEMTEEMAQLGKYKTWLADNLGTIALNAAYGTLTLEDFDLGMKLYTNESYRKVTDTSDMNVFSVIGPAAELLMNYLDWMESQGAQPNSKFQSIKMLKSLMQSPRNSYDEDE